MFSAEAVSARTPHQTINGFAIDLLYLARLAGLRIREVGIICHCLVDSRVRIRAGLASVLDVLRIRMKARPFSREFVRRASRSPRAALSDPD